MTKLKSASRFMARYSTPLKEVVRDIEEVQKRPQLCPRCNRKSLRRKGYARWVCKKCGAVLAGGAYAPQSKMGSIVERIIKKGEKYEAILEPPKEKEEVKP